MVEFLSPAWVATLNGLLRAGGVRAEDRSPLVIQQLIEHPDGIRSAYRIRVDANGAEAVAGGSDDATVTYRQSYEVARGVACGELDAHVEFLMGRIVVSGDTKALAGHRATLDRLAGALGAMRETTDF